MSPLDEDVEVTRRKESVADQSAMTTPAGNQVRKEEAPMDHMEEQKFQEALKFIDLTDTYNKEVPGSTAPHKREFINYGRFYLEAAKYGTRRAVLNVANDLAL